ncbi:glutathione S-transferase [Xylariaceae sp. FL0016]|nr:glutathione S-transferase [Xylariaceae sp. FL0016]
MTLIVHHLQVSQSDRIVWLCEELGIPYELKTYERSPILAPESYKALHPIKAAPVIEDGDVKLAESGACVEYICQTYGKGRFMIAPGAKEYPDFLYWFHFANGTFVSALMRQLTGMMLGAGPDNDSMKRFKEKFDSILSFMDERLSQVPWLAGDEMTAADVMNVCGLTSLRCFAPYDLSGYKHILAYLERVAGREAYRRALEKGDPELEVGQLTGGPPPPLQKGLAAAMKAGGK